MDVLNFVTVPIIVTVVYGAITLLKKAVNNNEKVLRLIPLIAAGLGAVLGIIAFFALPDIIPATNVFVALLVGGSSGLAATGTHQVFKQLISKANASAKKGDDGDTDPKDEDKQ